MRNTKSALKWIISLMEDNHIQYQVVGGLAAKTYGASRELVDIDLYVSGKDFQKACELAKDHLTWDPKHYKDNEWDIEFAKFEFDGQKVEIGNSTGAKRFDNETNEWIDENIDYDTYEVKEFLGVKFKVISKQKLIEYKRKLNREVDKIDLKQMEEAP